MKTKRSTPCPMTGSGRSQENGGNGNGNQKVIVIGNLGANPTVRTLPNSGQNVANFSLATTERFTDRSGTKQDGIAS
jgi:Single-strand binding protein family